MSYVTVAPRDFTPRVSGYGTVQPARVWTAVAEVAGSVAYLHPAFVRGGFVGAGEELIRLDAADYDLALQRAEADLAGAEARLDEMRASERTTAASLAIEREALTLAEVDLARTIRLADTGTVSSSVVDDRRRDVLAQRSKVQTHENALALLPSQIASLKHAVAASRTAKQAAALDLQRTVVRAPFDARVARADVEINQFVSAGAAMGALDGAAVAEIDVQVPQTRMAALTRLVADGLARTAVSDAFPAGPSGLRSVRRTSASGPGGSGFDDPRGLSAHVRLSLGEGETRWRGEVARLSDTVSAETRSVGVIVRVDEPYTQTGGEPHPPLVKGMFVRVELAAPPVPEVILLPRAAIRNGQVMLAAPDNRLVYAQAVPLFVDNDIAV
ncbi:MAG: HlyD family efflux transporter periplasmic adaptor subunit, partial [Pseudomonadota bacterium]